MLIRARTSDDLEQLSDRSMPGRDRHLIGAWVCRAANGVTGRANSCTPFGDPAVSVRQAVTELETWFRDRDLRPLFQIWDGCPPEVIEVLDDRHYATGEGAEVLVKDLGRNDWPAPSSSVEIEESVGSELVIRGLTPRLQELMMSPLPKLAASVPGGTAASQSSGIGVFDGSTLGIFAMRTEPDGQRQGFGTSVLNSNHGEPVAAYGWAMADADIIDFYQNRYDEAGRLLRANRSIEFVRTVDVLSRFLTSGPLRVLDVGGGAGIYAGWLAGNGHDVTLVDPVERHVVAAANLDPGPGSITAELGDALTLGHADNAFDAVLMFGPLYHLVERSDRVAAWTEAKRVCRPGGVIAAAMISRFASFRDMLQQDRLADGGIADLVIADLESGQHRNPDNVDGFFTTAYFHHPEEIAREAAAAGVEVERVIGVEGMTSLAPDVHEQLADETKRAVVLDLLRRTEEEASILGLSSHILAIARA